MFKVDKDRIIFFIKDVLYFIERVLYCSNIERRDRYLLDSNFGNILRFCLDLDGLLFGDVLRFLRGDTISW